MIRTFEYWEQLNYIINDHVHFRLRIDSISITVHSNSNFPMNYLFIEFIVQNISYGFSLIAT